MNSTVTLNRFVQIACLPSTDSISFPSEGLTGVIAGWGAQTFNGTNSELLKNVRLDIFSGATCDSQGYINYGNNYNSSFCAGNSAKDFCKGDDGNN